MTVSKCTILLFVVIGCSLQTEGLASVEEWYTSPRAQDSSSLLQTKSDIESASTKESQSQMLEEPIYLHRNATPADRPKSVLNTKKESSSGKAKQFPVEHILRQDATWRAVGWSVPVFILGISIPSLYADSTGITHGIACTLLSGTGSYLFAISADFTDAFSSPFHGLAYMGWVFVFIVFGALGLHVFWSVTNPTYSEELTRISRLSARLWASYLGSGVLNCCGLIVAQVAASKNLSGSAPLFSIACAYGILVAPFFCVYAKEQMSPGQVVGLLLVFLGVLVQSFVGWVPVAFSLCVMVFWAGEAICTRLGEMWGSPPCLGVLIRMGVMSFTGVLVVISCHTALGVPLLGTQLMLLALYNAIAPATTLWSLIRAFGAPDCKTGTITGILAGQTVVMSVMNVLIMGWVPSRVEWMGMICIVIGCFNMCFFNYPKSAKSDEASEDSHLVPSKVGHPA